MNRTKGIIGITFALIMIASIFTVLPVTAADKTIPADDDNPTMVLENHPEISASLRVYGEDNRGPWEGYDSKGQFVYSDYWDPFDPAALQKDVLTFNPAVIQDEFGMMSAMGDPRGDDANLKVFLRLWYEPEATWTKDIYDYPAIQVETTYMLINEQEWAPAHGEANSDFVFPIAESEPVPPPPDGGGKGTGLALFENPNSNPDNEWKTDLVYVGSPEYVGPYNKTTNGTIRLQKSYVMNSSDIVQFLDHKLRFDYIVLRNGKEFAKVTVWYAGNIAEDSGVRLLLGQFDGVPTEDPNAITFFDRHNNRFPTEDHAVYRTWYAKFSDSISDTQAEIVVGKCLQARDTFYVNAVRYDIPAIEVLDTDGNVSNGPDAFKYITLRTPLPKDDVSKLVPDDGKVSSQWIDTITPNEIIPVLPPFNGLYGNYSMIDDINVVLWEPTENEAEWPVGDPDGELGTEFWPWAERYLTMQEEQIVNETWCYEPKQVGANWMSHFAVERISLSSLAHPPIDSWIAYDPGQRVVEAEPLRFCYIDEDTEPEFTTNLLEILDEVNMGTPDLDELWTDMDIWTKPDDFTEFALPPRPDVQTPPLTKTGDYLLKTSYRAPNSFGLSDLATLTFAYDVEEEADVLNGLTMGDARDIYVNTVENITQVRVYGEDDHGPIRGYGNNGTYTYKWYQEPFLPQSIRKDSITFNPAIVQDYDFARMYANGEDIDVKKYLRMWYEPDHTYSKPEYKYPTIEVETTYLLIDSQDKLPISGSAGGTAFVFPIAANLSTAQPGLELFENPGSDPDAEYLVSLAYVDGTVEPYNKTVFDNATIRLEKTYKLNADGDWVQFLDHRLKLFAIVEDANGTWAKVQVEYVGNNYPDDQPSLTLGKFQDGTLNDPHANTFIGRHPNADSLYNYGKATHPGTTWYARFENAPASREWAEITVGKELRAGDTFFVDAVRYDVPAIEVLDTNNDTIADEFKYITLRTPLPKLDGVFIRPDRLDSNGNLPDDGMPGISSQQIVPIPPNVDIPLNPPFNMVHRIVDDIDISESTYPDVEDRIISWYDPLSVQWVEEAIEPRYSTNLLELLYETGIGTPELNETWVKYDVISRPDQYTAFRLPGDVVRYDFVNQAWFEELHNDYLVTTSFLAPNSDGYSDIIDPIGNIPRMAFRVDGIEKTGKYINEILELPPAPNNSAPVVIINVNGTSVAGCEEVEVCTNGTTDDATWPLRITVNWGDGETSVEQVMQDETSPVCFTHRYMRQDTYTITVTARDIYNAAGVNNTETVEVTSDCFVLTFKPGWNFFSLPVGSKTVDDVFGGHSGFGPVYRWDSTAQNWVALTGSDVFDPANGYIVHKTSGGTLEITVTGTAAVVADPTPIGKWQLVGVGSVSKTLSYWAYWWDPTVNGYTNTKTLQVARGYFVSI